MKLLSKFYLIVLFKISKNIEIYFYYIILLFYITINLRIKDNREFLLRNKKIILR